MKYENDGKEAAEYFRFSACKPLVLKIRAIEKILKGPRIFFPRLSTV